MYNEMTGVLRYNTPISEYVKKIRTFNGEYRRVDLDKPIQSIVAKTVVSNHLFRLFTPIGEPNTLYTVVTDILNTLNVDKLIINEDTIEVICIMLENEVEKVLRYVYRFDESQIKSVNMTATINSLKSDLKYIID